MNPEVNSLIRNFGKVYYTPKPSTNQYEQLYRSIDNIFNQALNSQIDRQQLYQELYNVLSRLKKHPVESGRPESRVNIITHFLEPLNFIPETILDVGAGTGDIIKSLRVTYNLSKDKVFAIDQKLPVINDVTTLTYVNNKIPLNDNSIDLIILFAVLHHIIPDDRLSFLDEITRVLKPGGYLIIREHDDDKTQAFFVFMDLIHIFWYIAYNETPDPLFLMSRAETQSLFKDVGLDNVQYVSYDDNIPNPQRLYHEMYTKKLYKFADSQAQSSLQEIINTIKLSPHTYESFRKLVPFSLQDELYLKYHSNFNQNWTDIIKDLSLSVIFNSLQYSGSLNGVYYITSEAVLTSFNDLNR